MHGATSILIRATFSEVGLLVPGKFQVSQVPEYVIVNGYTVMRQIPRASISALIPSQDLLVFLDPADAALSKVDLYVAGEFLFVHSL